MGGTAAGLVGVLVLLLAGLALEVCARVRPGPAPAAQALTAAMRTAAGRTTVLIAWLWLGLHFLAR